MDRRRMDAAGGRVVHQDRRTRKLAVVVAAQNVLVTVCLVVTLYLCWEVQSRTPRAEQASEDNDEDNVHIQFYTVSVVSENVTLQFGEVKSSNMMNLANGKKDKIYVNCTGPYVLYMDVCFKSMDEKNATGKLELKVVGRDTPVSYFPLQTSHEVCRGLHSIAYLRKNEEASLRLWSYGEFIFRNVTVGLSYLLGSQGRCEF